MCNIACGRCGEVVEVVEVVVVIHVVVDGSGHKIFEVPTC